MRVLEPKELEARRKHRTKKHKKQRRKHALSLAIILTVGVYVSAVLVVPLPLLQAETSTIKLETIPPVSMPWPTYGQAAIGAVGYGLLDQHGEQKQLPIASVAKVITAVAVLKVKPINPGETGELITITPDDVRTYNQYIEEGQSVVRVVAGEQLTEYQALQALMLPSANNLAEVLARWAFGSIDNYLKFVNPFTKTLGMENTIVADASGYNPGTMSTAVDLTKLAEIAMNNPILASIVGQPEADLPTAGKVYNVNNFLGTHGIVGIKTGNTDEAGGCYMFAAKRQIDETNSVTVVGVVIGAQSRGQAMNDSLPLIDEAFKGFSVRQLVKTDQVVGVISQTSGSQAAIKVRQGLSVVAWAGQDARVAITPKNLGRQVNAGDEAGTLTVHMGNMTYEVVLVASQTIKNHSVPWRIRHAGGYL
jgi:D-alanyl-D-alanine carboxypeptidase (penicillin-binding protein 5/6)